MSINFSGPKNRNLRNGKKQGGCVVLLSECWSLNELVWWRRLCAELGHPMRGATRIRCDNEAVIGLAARSCKFETTNHIRLKYHVLREYQEEGKTFAIWCLSAAQLADIN